MPTKYQITRETQALIARASTLIDMANALTDASRGIGAVRAEEYANWHRDLIAIVNSMLRRIYADLSLDGRLGLGRHVSHESLEVARRCCNQRLGVMRRELRDLRAARPHLVPDEQP